MLRSAFLYLSHAQKLRRWMETSAIARRLSERFVAGETLQEAIQVSRRVNGEGIKITLDHLGENVTSLPEAEAFSDVYVQMLEHLAGAGIDGNVSLKLTQFGMDLSEEACARNLEKVIRRARDLNNFVRVDMESTAYTDRTLALVRDFHARYGCVGAVLQSYLHRSQADLEDLCARGIRVRLCKGAYLEPPEVAFPHKSDVDANYVRLMKSLLENGVYPAIATHDEKIIRQARDFGSKRGISPDRFEFQMLYGIRRDLQRQLVKDGYRLRLYIPFGKAWYPYFMRRLAERPANVIFLARNLLRQ